MDTAVNSPAHRHTCTYICVQVPTPFALPNHQVTTHFTIAAVLILKYMRTISCVTMLHWCYTTPPSSVRPHTCYLLTSNPGATTQRRVRLQPGPAGDAASRASLP
jgi:hypothetical protein